MDPGICGALGFAAETGRFWKVDHPPPPPPTGCHTQSQVTLQVPIYFFINRKSSCGEVSRRMQMCKDWCVCDGGGAEKLIESRAAFQLWFLFGGVLFFPFMPPMCRWAEPQALSGCFLTQAEKRSCCLSLPRCWKRLKVWSFFFLRATDIYHFVVWQISRKQRVQTTADMMFRYKFCVEESVGSDQVLPVNLLVSTDLHHRYV